MTTDAKLLLTALCLVLLSATSCRHQPPVEPPAADLDDTTLARHASVGPFQPQAGRVIIDNDASFAEKLRMVESARSSIDMAYFVFHEDHTSSVFAQALLAAAGRGVDVRIVIDYNTNYDDLDLFTMLEKEASSSPGSIQVRFYNRPTRRIVEDAAYMTIGCSEVFAADGGEGQGDCDDRKFEFIESAFAEEEKELAGLPISNLNIASSGLFLSGLFSSHRNAMALAVIKGQELDLDALKGSAQGSGDRTESVKKLAKIYWRSRNGSLFTRVVNKLKLAVVFLRFRSEIKELKGTITSLLPVGKSEERGGWQDWEYRTDYLHQKLLLVDGDKVLAGGRNIGDSYHMRPDPMLEGHAYFEDTEIYLELPGDQAQEFRTVFDRLWNFRHMVATTDEVWQHAPNDFVSNKEVLEAAEEACANTAEEQREACIDREFAAGERKLEDREAARHEKMLHLVAELERGYTKAPADALHLSPSGADVATTFAVDPGAQAYYLENVPYDKNLAAAERKRLYGGRGMREDETGKYLHLLWRRGLTNTCLTSSADAPQRVFLLNPYYLPPATLLRAAGWMVDGTLDCRHVTVQVLTNSIATNDLKIINPLAHVGLRAFSEFYHQHGDPEKRAKFDFYEYRKKSEIPNFAIHSKVSILGDDIIIGSANIDARSYMMDANNGILVRNAPGLRQSYLDFLDAQLADPAIVTHLDDYFRSTSADDIKPEKLQQLRDLAASSELTNSLSPEHQAMLNKAFAGILNQVYDLTHAVLRGDPGGVDKYNRLLKFL